jgi:hypothetical protein
MRWWLPAALATGYLVASPPSRADDVIVGQVVKTDRREVYANLGQGRGVDIGAKVRFKRPLVLKHPVTRKPVTDWLPIATGTITDVGDHLARIALPPELLTQLKVGDVAEVYVERTEAPPVVLPPPVPLAPPSTAPIPTLDADTASVLQVWRASTAGSIDSRIAAWSGWLATHGDSRYAAEVRADLEVLRATQAAMAPDHPIDASKPSVRIEHNPPRAATSGTAIPVAFVLSHAQPVVAASMHVRTIGQPTFERVELTREHGIYLRGLVPAAMVAAPGVEYFVETVGSDGAPVASFGSDVAPTVVTVIAPPVVNRFTPTTRRTQLTMIGSYLDFATFDQRGGATADRRDRFAEAEIDVRYRLEGMIRGVRVGFGSYGGRGGFANRIWTATDPAPLVGFQYGYAEAEVRFPTLPNNPEVGIAGRFVAGVGRDGFGVGGAARIRLGDPDRTNVSAGVSGVQQIGFLSDLRLETWPRAEVPVAISVAVTDQPGNGDLGVRLATDVGWRVRPTVRPTVRVSWQGRTATHAGIGGGLGLVFDW